MRGVVTLTEDYETRFLCFSPQVSPGIAGAPLPRRVSRRSVCPGTDEALAASCRHPGSDRQVLWQQRRDYSYLSRL